MSDPTGTPYQAIEIVKGIWSIEEGFVRSFLMEGTDKAMLVDTGFGSGDIKSFAQSITDKPLFLVNTHTDGDHIGCNDRFDKALMHREEEGYFRAKKPDCSCKVEYLTEGDILDLGNRRFEIIHIPGHTPGSIVLFDRANRLMITGDSVQAGTVFLFGEGRNLPQYIKSMKKLMPLMDGVDTILASHDAVQVGPDILQELIEGAERLLKGELEGQEPPRPMPCKLYAAGRVKFLYKDPNGQ